jgi:hypothetical protein
MSTLQATINPIVIDNRAAPPQTAGTTTIAYNKEQSEELWELPPGGSWSQLNVHQLTGLGDAADFSGSYSRTLTPGQIYRAGLFLQTQGPLTTDPIPRADLMVFAILKGPEVRNLIVTEDQNTGGTYHRHNVTTNVATSVALVGASRRPPTVDADGIPSLVDPDGGLAGPTGVAVNHTMDLLPLVPGNHYFFTVMVVDAQGNWEVRGSEFDTLRRKLTIKFPRVHIYNDGDSGKYGDGEFWFRVSAGNDGGALHALEDFHLPEMDIDDWSENGRPYPVGFAYAELEPQPIPPERPSIWVSSWAIEHDGIFDADEGAGALKGTKLGLPAGPGERVTNSSFTMDCPTTTVDDDFHYGVEVNYSVEYLP